VGRCLVAGIWGLAGAEESLQVVACWSGIPFQLKRSPTNGCAVSIRASQSLSLSLLLGVSCVSILVRPAAAQYKVTTLVSNERLDLHSVKPAAGQDGHLANAWGLAYLPTSPFWVSDEMTGVSTLYRANGDILPLVVTVPGPANRPVSSGSPTGIVANATKGFVISSGAKSGPGLFIFDTLDGTISGWNPTVSPKAAVVMVDNSAAGAAYTGLAIATSGSDTFLYAANAARNVVEMYDSKFSLVKTFTDPDVPAPNSVYGIQAIEDRIYVTFAPIPPGKPGTGSVDVFSADGTFIRRIASRGSLNIPWGLAMAPADFGKFSNALLVGNLQDGKINAFDPITGNHLGALQDGDGNVIVIPGVWALTFGGGTDNNGPKNDLFFTAGPDNFNGGVFGVIAP
jgi:uncharacterized protein (TIGR03118 family)